MFDIMESLSSVALAHEHESTIGFDLNLLVFSKMIGIFSALMFSIVDLFTSSSTLDEEQYGILCIRWLYSCAPSSCGTLAPIDGNYFPRYLSIAMNALWLTVGKGSFRAAHRFASFELQSSRDSLAHSMEIASKTIMKVFEDLHLEVDG